MSDFGSWMQANWNALGTLLIQLAFLIAGVWCVSNLLKTLRSFQEQLGAVLKLLITASPVERQAATGAVRHSLSDSSPFWLMPSETPATNVAEQPEIIGKGPSRFAVAWHNSIIWLKTPMHSGEQASWRRVIRWLQSPAGS